MGGGDVRVPLTKSRSTRSTLSLRAGAMAGVEQPDPETTGELYAKLKRAEARVSGLEKRGVEGSGRGRQRQGNAALPTKDLRNASVQTRKCSRLGVDTLMLSAQPQLAIRCTQGMPIFHSKGRPAFWGVSTAILLGQDQITTSLSLPHDHVIRGLVGKIWSGRTWPSIMWFALARPPWFMLVVSILPCRMTRRHCSALPYPLRPSRLPCPRLVLQLGSRGLCDGDSLRAVITSLGKPKALTRLAIDLLLRKMLTRAVWTL